MMQCIMTMVIRHEDYYPEGYLLLMSFGAFVLLFGALIKEKGKISIPKYAWALIMFIPLTAFVFVGWIVLNETVTITEKLAAMVYFVLHNGAFLFLYGEMVSFMQKSQKQQEELAQSRFYEAQIEMMQNSLVEMKTMRHDMKNKLLAFSKNTEIGECEISDMLEMCCKDVLFKRSGNAVIDSIIEYKLRQVQTLNICFNADILVSEELECMVSDLGVVIGNLLDNAIEAVKQVDNKWIRLKMEYNKGRLMIKMCNPFTGSVQYKGSQILSSKKDTKNHGIGLTSVKNVVKKYDGEMELSHNDGNFEVTILMYLTLQEKENRKLTTKKDCENSNKSIQELDYIHEFDGLPEELIKWGKTAIIQILSPQKQHEAAKEVRENIDALWDSTFSEGISDERKAGYVLDKLGDVNVAAEELAEKYQLKENPIQNKVIGAVMLLISAICGYRAYVIFFVDKAKDILDTVTGEYFHGRHRLAQSGGAFMFVALVFGVLGLRLLLDFGGKRKVDK